MATANIVKAGIIGSQAYMAANVAEGGSLGNVEYIGYIDTTIDLKDFGFAGQTFTDLTTANKRAVLIACVKKVRDAQLAQANNLALTGSITI